MPGAKPTPANLSFRGFRESVGLRCAGDSSQRRSLVRVWMAYHAVSQVHGPIRARGLAFRGVGPYGARWYVPCLRVSGRRIAASIPFAMDLP